MRISIITICFNCENHITDTIFSVINQTYKNIEYIIIDGASNDKTIDIIKAFSGKITKIISEPDKGIYDAINKGIKASSGDVVGLIHAGDELYDNTILQKISDHFLANDIDALYGHSVIMDDNSRKIFRLNISPEYRKNLFAVGWFPSHQSFYAKRELFEQFGYYNLKYHIAADYELLLRLLYVNKVKVKLLDNFIVKFKLGGTSTKSLKNIIKLNKECIEAWKDNGLQMPVYCLPLKFIRKIKQIVLAKLNHKNDQ